MQINLKAKTKSKHL